MIRQSNAAVKWLKRPPARFDGAIGIELGRLIEFQIGNEVNRASKSTKLFWFPHAKSLGVFGGSSFSSGRPSKGAWDKIEDTAAGKRAGKVFEAWAQRDVKQARTVKFPNKNAVWATYNVPMVRIDYWSDKWGSTSEYTHNFGKGVRLYLLGNKSKPGSVFYVFRGGRLTVTARGIVG